jgi:hypothetical protein
MKVRNYPLLLGIFQTDKPTKSATILLCLANYILIPWDTQIMKSIVDLKWISLVAYVMIEQLFLATFRRFDFGNVVFWSLIASNAQLWLQFYYAPSLVLAQDMGLLLPVVVDAAVNVGVLVLAINLSSPALPKSKPFFEISALVMIAVSKVLILGRHSVDYPLKAVLSNGTWEQLRLLTSFLFLRISAGAPLQAIVLLISEHWELRIGVTRSGCNLDLDEPSSGLKGEIKPQKNFAANVNLALILGGAGVVILAGVIGGGLFLVLKAIKAFA